MNEILRDKVAEIFLAAMHGVNINAQTRAKFMKAFESFCNHTEEDIEYYYNAFICSKIAPLALISNVTGITI